MRVIHLSCSDIVGGAARAAYRIHHCLREAGIDSRLWVNQARAGDWTVEGPRNQLEKAMGIIRQQVVKSFVKTLKTENPILHSPAVFTSSWVKRINASDADIVHLHWVQGEMLSIAEIGRIKKPIVWTLHDMWAFCGAEHYTENNCWQDAYARNSRPSYESGFDLNRWTWQRKRKHWHEPFQIVSPSLWLADCVRKSTLMAGWPVTVIPNPIDTNIWKPVDKTLARSLFHLPQDVPLLLFGAIGGSHDPRKGFDLLCSALDHLRGRIAGLELIVFGQREPRQPEDLGFPVHYTGHLHDELSLRILYSAADVMVIPSRQDNLPNTGVEAQSCGIPVVAFDIGGLPDIVEHQRTGYLATPFDTHDLAAGIKWSINQADQSCQAIRDKTRHRAVHLFDSKSIAMQYKMLYESMLS